MLLSIALITANTAPAASDPNAWFALPAATKTHAFVDDALQAPFILLELTDPVATGPSNLQARSAISEALVAGVVFGDAAVGTREQFEALVSLFANASATRQPLLAFRGGPATSARLIGWYGDTADVSELPGILQAYGFSVDLNVPVDWPAEAADEMGDATQLAAISSAGARIAERTSYGIRSGIVLPDGFGRRAKAGQNDPKDGPIDLRSAARLLDVFVDDLGLVAVTIDGNSGKSESVGFLRQEIAYAGQS